MKFINIHSHSQSSDEATLTVRSIHQREQDAISPADCAACSVGLHPWFLESARVEADFDWLVAQVEQPNVIAIGECGLDAQIDVPWGFQQAVFFRQVLLAEEIGKPLILHCVKAYEQMVFLQKTLRPRQHWIIHGFDKHPNVAKTLLKAGFFLSFGAALLRDNSHAAAALQLTPANRLFLENDDKDISIQIIYEKAAALKKVAVPVLQAKIDDNFEAIFPNFG